MYTFIYLIKIRPFSVIALNSKWFLSVIVPLAIKMSMLDVINTIDFLHTLNSIKKQVSFDSHLVDKLLV